MTKTALVASDQLYRAGLGCLFDGTRFELVAMGATVNETVAQCSDIKPDLILLNLDTGQKEVRRLVAQARRLVGEARVVVVAPFGCGEAFEVSRLSRRLWCLDDQAAMAA